MMMVYSQLLRTLETRRLARPALSSLSRVNSSKPARILPPMPGRRYDSIVKQTKAELVAEVARLRCRVAELEGDRQTRASADGAMEPEHDRLAAVEAILDNTPAVIYVKDGRGRYLLA